MPHFLVTCLEPVGVNNYSMTLISDYTKAQVIAKTMKQQKALLNLIELTDEERMELERLL